MTDDQKKMLTEELLGEGYCDVEKHHNIHLPAEYCYHCDSCQTHFKESEKHLHQNRTFLAGDDLIDVKEELVKKGLWREFFLYTFKIYAHTPEAQFLLHSAHGVSADNHVAWLFRPTDEKGNAHFCRLVIECPAVLQRIKEARNGPTF